MKREKWLSCLIGAIFAFAGALAGVGCVMTGFGYDKLMSFPTVIVLLACWSTILGVVLMLPHGGKWLAALCAVLAVAALNQKEILLQVESFLNKSSLVYNAAYGCGMIIWSESVEPDMPVTWAMILMGFLSATGICWAVCRRKWLPIGLVTGFLPLVLCCVVTDTVPGKGYLYLLLSTMVLVILPHLAGRVRKENGIRLTAMLLVPVLLCMLLLFGQVRPDNYLEQSAKLQQTVSAIMQRLPFTGTGPGINSGTWIGGISMDRVDLAAIGPQGRYSYAVMDVVAPVTKTLYLRGQALDSYDGTSWSLGLAADKIDPYWPYTGIGYRGKMVITTRTVQPLKFLPYYTGETWSQQEDGMAAQQKNEEQLTEYTSVLWVPTAGEAMYSVMNSMEGMDAYLELPVATRQRAEAILEGLFTYERTMTEKAETIRYFVETSAKYDLNTQSMPEGEEDFALWFLEESDSGYCVHFASAAAVLLRAAGIPARYVTGYTVNAMNGRRVTVTAEQAHAWVEYLDEELSWKVLEATPVDPDNAQPRPQVYHPTQPSTQPPTERTEPTTAPTAPTESEATENPGDTNSPSTWPTNATTKPTVGTVKPTGGTSQEPQEQVDLTWLWRVLMVVGWIALAVAAAILQYALRLRYRRKKMYTGKPNRQAICRWRYGKHLAKRMRCAMPERLDFLAEKAAYSQYTLENEELAEFEAWLEGKHQELSRWPWLPRLFVKLLFALD